MLETFFFRVRRYLVVGQSFLWNILVCSLQIHITILIMVIHSLAFSLKPVLIVVLTGLRLKSGICNTVRYIML